MQITNLMNIGAQGFNDATSRASEAAQEIASTSVKDASKESISSQDLTNSLVDMEVAKLDALANAKVMQTATDMVGNLLDIEV